jgi:hypothetical protein
MPYEKIQYKKALKKQSWTIAIVSIALMVFTFSLDLKDDWQLYIWLILFVIAAFIVFALLKQQSNEAKCPHCETDLFGTIQVALDDKVEFNYCPTCGKHVEL